MFDKFITMFKMLEIGFVTSCTIIVWLNIFVIITYLSQRGFRCDDKLFTFIILCVYAFLNIYMYILQMY